MATRKLFIMTVPGTKALVGSALVEVTASKIFKGALPTVAIWITKYGTGCKMVQLKCSAPCLAYESVHCT